MRPSDGTMLAFGMRPDREPRMRLMLKRRRSPYVFVRGPWHRFLIWAANR